MNRTMLCMFALGLMAVSAHARGLAQTDANCAAIGSVDIVTYGGSCNIVSVVDCAATAASKSAFEAAFEEWFADDYEAYVCDKVRREAAARAVAVAIAELSASAFATIECSKDSYAEGCAWGIGEGDAWAIATSKAVAVAVADMGADRAFCEADVTALSSAVVDIAGKAQADACGKGVGLRLGDYKNIFVRAVQKGIAEAFAVATAEFCNAGADVVAKTKCKGRASSKGEGDVIIVGDGEGKAKADKPGFCERGADQKCCQRSHKQPTCLCIGCNNPLKMTSDYDDSKGQSRSWNDAKGGKCVCKY